MKKQFSLKLAIAFDVSIFKQTAATNPNCDNGLNTEIIV